MDILELIDNLEDAIESSTGVPLTGKCLINKEEIFELVQEIRLQLPEDLKQAKWVKEERQRILFEAQKEAEGIVKHAEDKIVALINENEITRRAEEQAREIVENAQKTAKEIRIGTREYADGVLADLEAIISDIKSSVFKSMTEVSKQVDEIEKVCDIIKDNRITLKR